MFCTFRSGEIREGIINLTASFGASNISMEFIELGPTVRGGLSQIEEITRKRVSVNRKNTVKNCPPKCSGIGRKYNFGVVF